jgi:coenzyme PQQ precursor peptide PqqA
MRTIEISWGGSEVMEWMTPTFEEIDLGCEINSYSCAEL